MAYKVFDGLTGDKPQNHTDSQIITVDGPVVEIPDPSYVTDAQIQRVGMDLVLEGPDGTVVIQNYFSQATPPNLVAPDGTTLTPELVNSFAKSALQYADAGSSVNDESPVGAVQEVTGEAKVTHLDGTVEVITAGTAIYQGDVIETEGSGAVNIVFIDKTSLAVSENARLAIDEYVFDPTTQAGNTDFSILKGMFVFTSGLIGRDDPDDVKINTPSGSIGIRGTIIAGNVDTGEITVVEGAIVLTDFHGNSVTLATQYETAKFTPSSGTIEKMGTLAAHDVMAKFSSVSAVAPDLFSTIQDSATDSKPGVEGQGAGEQSQQQQGEGAGEAGHDPAKGPVPPANQMVPNGPPPVDGTVPPAGSEGMMQPPPVDGAMQPPPGTAGMMPPTELPPVAPPSGGMMMPGEIMMSGDVMGYGPLPPPPTSFSAPLTGSGAMMMPPPPPPSPPPGVGNYAPPPPPPPPPPPSDSASGSSGGAAGVFDVVVTLLAPSENVANATVAEIKGVFTGSTTITLTGVSQNLYTLVSVDANTYQVQLKSGVLGDFEKLKSLTFVAENSDRSIALTRGYSVPLTDVDEPTIVLSNEPHNPGGVNYYAASDNNVWEHDFSHDFGDPDGDIASFGIVWNSGAPSAPISYTFDVNTGMLNITTTNLAADSVLDFDIEAKDSSGAVLATKNIQFDVVDTLTLNIVSAPISTPFTLSAATGVFTSTNPSLADGFIINGNNKTVYLDGGNDSLSLSGTSALNKVYGGLGDDTIIMNSTTAINNVFVMGEGKDTFDVLNMNNKFYGGLNDDIFNIKSDATLTGWETMAAGNGLLDGGQNDHVYGSGSFGDILKFDLSITRDIDFGLIDHGLIRDIETIHTDNGSTNNIFLNYDDVINMTNGDKTLTINMDANDTLNFNNTSGSAFYLTGSETTGSETYDVYTNGTVTLLVDTQGTTTGV